jgi:predicted RNA binding protein YcfA (HicA-like mRNA interferase family)
VTVRDVVSMSQKEAWYQVVQRGSHCRVRHPTKTGRVIVASEPSHELAPGVVDASCTKRDCPRRSVAHLDRGVRAHGNRLERLRSRASQSRGCGHLARRGRRLTEKTTGLHLDGLAGDGLPIPDPHAVDIGLVEWEQPA